jgi:hypothetical protein
MIVRTQVEGSLARACGGRRTGLALQPTPAQSANAAELDCVRSRMIWHKECLVDKPVRSFFALRRRNLDLALPEHGYLYFDHLTSELRIISESRNQTSQGDHRGLTVIIDEMNKKRQEHSLTWTDLYALEFILSRLLPPERLPREVWSLRSRYRDVAGLPEYEAYLASKPPDLAGQVEEKDLRADIEYLLGQIYLRYAITPINQYMSDSISNRIASIVLGGIGLILVVIAIILLGKWTMLASAPATLLLVLFAGAMGGLLSMQQRYQSVLREGDPIDNISELTLGWSKVYLPAISGAIFAALLYMLIIGGLLQGDLFPKVADFTKNSDNGTGVGLMDLLEHGRPASTSNYAKLIIWSFLAGFAERFVPDTLSRFISKREGDNRSST